MRAAVYGSRTRRNGVPGMVAKMVAGIQRHGIVIDHADWNQPDIEADFALCWGWRIGSTLRKNGYEGPILVMERGYLPDRFEWTSLGWDGLNGRARFNEPQDKGERFWRNFGHLACEWERYDGYYLVMGQVLGDMSLRGVDFVKWVKETIDTLDKLGVDVRFRPHPEAIRRGQAIPAPQYMIAGGTLADALSEAACVVTYNSNSGVDAVLAGIPAVTYDEGAMAWDVTSHHALQELVMPDRNEWFRRMAWTQWSMPEIERGEAWEVVKGAM